MRGWHFALNPSEPYWSDVKKMSWIWLRTGYPECRIFFMLTTIELFNFICIIVSGEEKLFTQYYFISVLLVYYVFVYITFSSIFVHIKFLTQTPRLSSIKWKFNDRAVWSTAWSSKHSSENSRVPFNWINIIFNIDKLIWSLR